MVVSKSWPGVHFAEAFEAFDFDAVAADFEHLGEDFRHAEERVDLLRLDEFEERSVLGAEVIDVQAGFVQSGQQAGDRPRLVDFDEAGAAVRVFRLSDGAVRRWPLTGAARVAIEHREVGVGVIEFAQRLFVEEVARPSPRCPGGS